MNQEIIDPNTNGPITRIVLPELKFSRDFDDEDEEKDGLSQVSMDSHLKRLPNTSVSVASHAEDLESQASGRNSTSTANKSYYKVPLTEHLEIFLKPEEIKPPRWTYLRFVGVLLFLVGIVEIGIGAKIYSIVSNETYGAWWAGLVAVIGGIFGMTSTLHLNLVIAASLTMSPSLVASIVGAVTDGFIANSYSNFQTCVRQEDGTFYYYGQTNGTYAENSLVCFEKYADSNPRSSDCVCIDSDFKCSPDIRLAHSDDCGVLLNYYPNELYVSMGLCIGLAIIGLIGSIISCWNVWHKDEKERKIRKTKSMERPKSERSTQL